MTGPEHYREAERLIRDARIPEDLTQAQVHATLALAAATAMAGRPTRSGLAEGSRIDGMDTDDYVAWNDACGVEGQ